MVEAGLGDLTDDERLGRVKIAGIKVFMDGAMSDRTAWTDAPYPGSCRDHGMRSVSDTELRKAVEWARRNRLHVAVHAMGDRALCVSHSIFLFAEYESYQRNLSNSQLEIAYPIRSFCDRVAYTALASDNPATAWSDADNVFVSVKAAVLREAYNGADIGKHEAITVPQALMLYTGLARQVSPLDGVGLIQEGCECTRRGK
ncbi:amidohydrolase family protein [Streptomyces sp. NEAU-YJ-81]|uniref:amidohydrolase family protein n=1 Tax=Streptomyces sp. NEAU-YJ-81 TaxID=2820288 RepID=UPI001ABBFD71|nr:amidohydrolase family protein [Streptomyces sp. NEAU-YJ-81]MBO3681395.1 amidohydrolase family protein [Streptomyces sp. NEAU-YJ-81]